MEAGAAAEAASERPEFEAEEEEEDAVAAAAVTDALHRLPSTAEAQATAAATTKALRPRAIAAFSFCFPCFVSVAPREEGARRDLGARVKLLLFCESR